MLQVLLSQMASGLALGCIYVMIALGMSMIFGVLGIVNLAHGTLFALGAYIALSLLPHVGWSVILVAPLVVGLIGMVIEVGLIRRLYGKEPLFSLVMTFAIALMIEALIRVVWGSGGQPFRAPLWLGGFVEFGPVLVTRYRFAVVILVALVLLVLWLALEKTAYGRILRAGSRDPEMVSMLGINMKRVFAIVFGCGSALAGLAGLIAAPLWSVTPSMSQAAIMPAFVVVTIGGLGSYRGAVIAGLGVGIVTALTVQFWPAASAAAMYVLMAAILILRPHGLLGERTERFG